MIYETDPDLHRNHEHRYFVGDRELEGVTATLKDNGLVNDEWFTEEHSSRGMAIHAELANIARGLQPFAFIDPDLYAWRQSGIDFLDMLRTDGAEILGVEVMRYHHIYKYAGAMDLVVRWRGYEHVLDFKSGKATKATRYQLAAYDILLGPTQNHLPRKRAAVELDRDGGRIRLIEYNGVEYFGDSNTFLALLAASRTRKLCGAKLS